jgi:uracil phosphoribosyltransferase
MVNDMKSFLISKLRDKNTSTEEFRSVSEKLAAILAGEAAEFLQKKDIKIKTPLAKTEGCELNDDLVLVPILRSGIALLSVFLKFYQKANVGFVGLKRDEVTAIAEQYYCKLPHISKNTEVLLLDPMIATGGSGIDALKLLRDAGVNEEKITFVAIIAAQEGVEAVRKEFPKINLVIAQIDEKLNDKKFIVPGLGDFGDRYFGTPER